MVKKIVKGVSTFLKTNFVFCFGMIIGSIIGTCTTIAVTMGMYGGSETLAIYRNAICGG